MLLFRDYLRAHPHSRAEVARRKRELAGRFAQDREAYQAEKDAIVEKTLAQARGERPGG